MPKPRILFPISFNFSIRYLLRTGFLESIKDFCEPIVCLAWEQEDLCIELKRANIEYFVESIAIDNDTSKLNQKIQNFFQFKLTKNKFYSAITHRHIFKLRNLKKIKYLIKVIKFRFLYTEKQYYNWIKSYNKNIEISVNYINAVKNLKRYNVKGVFTLTPFLYLDEIYCSASKSLKLPVFYSALSFDNITGRALFNTDYFKYAYVWNEINRSELINLSKTNPIVAKVVGVPQFDFYYKGKEYILDINDWKNKKGINPEKKVILYGANSKSYISNEKLYIENIDKAISNGLVRGNPVILIRPHPTDSIIDWIEFVKTLKNVILEYSIENNQSEDGIYNKYSNFKNSDIIALSSSLCHSDIHISIASTMALDGMAFDKPIVCPYFGPDLNLYENWIIRGFYLSDHYKTITSSGAIYLPRSYKKLIRDINDALEHPLKKQNERKELMKKIVGLSDGLATNRLITAFQEDINYEFSI
jgi:hypothetical protein